MYRDRERTKSYDDFDKVRLVGEREEEGLFSPFTFLCFSLLLVLSGLYFLYSSSYDAALRMNHAHYYYLFLQLMGVVAGLIIGFACQFVSPRYLSKSYLVLMPLGYILLVFSLFKRFNYDGYFAINGFPVVSAPFFACIGSISLISGTVKPIMEQKKEMRGILYALIILSVVGSAVLSAYASGLSWYFIITFTCVSILSAAGAKKSFVITSFVFSLVTGAMILFLDRSMTISFSSSIFPVSDSALYDQNLYTSQMALSDGGLFGRGIGKGLYKLGALRETESGFVFSSFVEETGILGAVLLIACYSVLLLIGVRTEGRARKRENSFIGSSTLGFTVAISLIAAFNMMYVTGIFPFGKTFLPFFSSCIGNETLLVAILAVLYKYIYLMGRPDEKIF